MPRVGAGSTFLMSQVSSTVTVTCSILSVVARTRLPVQRTLMPSSPSRVRQARRLGDQNFKSRPCRPVTACVCARGYAHRLWSLQGCTRSYAVVGGTRSRLLWWLCAWKREMASTQGRTPLSLMVVTLQAQTPACHTSDPLTNPRPPCELKIHLPAAARLVLQSRDPAPFHVHS